MPSVIASEVPEPDDALRILASHFGMEFVATLPTPSAFAIAVLPADVARRFQVAPVDLERNDDSVTLKLATSRPNDLEAADTLCALLRCDIEFIATPPGEIHRAIQNAYPPNA